MEETPNGGGYCVHSKASRVEAVKFDRSGYSGKVRNKSASEEMPQLPKKWRC